MTVLDWDVPATCGDGSPETCVAEDQLPLVILPVEYLMSYEVAVPEELSSPGAVQDKSADDAVAFEADKSETAAGAVVSAELVVARLGKLEIAEVLGTSSEVLTAKK